MQIRHDLDTKNKKDIALELAHRGFYVFPIKAGTKDQPQTRWSKGGPGECATNDPYIVNEWWERWPRANIGIATEPSGLVVLDVDVKHGKRGDISYMMLDLHYVVCPPTVQVQTSSGGFHEYYRTKTPVPSRTNLLKNEIGEGLDVRSRGGYVVGPGSNIGTKRYRLMGEVRHITDAPPELLALIRRDPGTIEAEGSASSTTMGTSPGRFTPEQLESMLAYLDPTEFRDHDEWFQLMCACHFATDGQGREEFVDWSTSDPVYSDHDVIISTRWASLGHTKYSGKPVTERTLIKLVREAGGPIPGESPEDVFEAFPPDHPDRFLNLEQIRNMPPATWLIDRFIPEGSFSILYGTPVLSWKILAKSTTNK